jgi:hypothetical protein
MNRFRARVGLLLGLLLQGQRQIAEATIESFVAADCSAHLAHRVEQVGNLALRKRALIRRQVRVDEHLASSVNHRKPCPQRLPSGLDAPTHLVLRVAPFKIGRGQSTEQLGVVPQTPLDSLIGVALDLPLLIEAKDTGRDDHERDITAEQLQEEAGSEHEFSSHRLRGIDIRRRERSRSSLGSPRACAESHAHARRYCDLRRPRAHQWRRSASDHD